MRKCFYCDKELEPEEFALNIELKNEINQVKIIYLCEKDAVNSLVGGLVFARMNTKS